MSPTPENKTPPVDLTDTATLNIDFSGRKTCWDALPLTETCKDSFAHRQHCYLHSIASMITSTATAAPNVCTL